MRVCVNNSPSGSVDDMMRLSPTNAKSDIPMEEERLRNIISDLQYQVEMLKEERSYFMNTCKNCTDCAKSNSCPIGVRGRKRSTMILEFKTR